MVQMANLGLFWDTYVGHDEVGQLQDVTIIAVNIFGFMNFPQNCTQGVPRWSKWPIWPSYDSHVDHDEVGQLQDVTIIAVSMFGFMNFPQNWLWLTC